LGPKVEGGARHLPGPWERVRGAAVIAGGLATGARAAVFGPLALLLLVMAALYLLFPYSAALVSALVSALVGSALAVRALSHRARG
jgi:hypothetical protein